ncbi:MULTISPECIES: LysE family translocator [Kribbella]|jgi:threonine/homoserine/homoserine lactone efflux protein|uniref:Threonine/homoserine/homoserine lactone efflux protein n=1 Tax=Kribbella pratensis TaxID=2512112 RepID=A0ABY2FJH5_9ACTN|nr:MULTISPECIES: LysE family translocator [Kribbella]TDW86656.1 threonine/homoserine/homoserine lactone efflux protein [Kribbella sp. VKM Ac-2566]TDW93276.1 threonine/homoserine/homoserine lactone efflux protein [Kribbella pratensis]
MMIGQLLGFTGATVVLVGMPGPNNLYISLRSLTQGRRAGVVSALAIETGTLVYIVVTALGLATLVQTSPTLFTAITVAGALYLAYLGLKLLKAPAGDHAADIQAAPLGRVFRDGVVVNLLNPKAALFFLAFLPQFATRGADPAQLRTELLVLGVGALLIGLTLDLCYAIGADAVGRRFRSVRTTSRRRNLIVAAIYLGLSAFALITAL